MRFEEAQQAVRNGQSAGSAARHLVEELTPEELLWCLDGDAPARAGLAFLVEKGGFHQMTFDAGEVERVGLPGIHFTDGPRGCIMGNATAFPVPMARGATWDPDLEARVGQAIGRELRAVGVDLTGAVCVNVLRHPAWGRAQETYGEDPHHVGELGAALTRGLQQHVMACVKHFACNSMENARFSVDIEVDEVPLHEVFLPQFRRIVDEGVASVMTAYNSVNGEWCGESHALIKEILRGEWGFEGFVISDWVLGLRDASASVSAGLDIEMPYRMLRYRDLRDALDSGRASWDDVKAAVARLVATLLRFDDVLAAPSPDRAALGAPEHRALAREVASRSVVLLRNEPVRGRPVLPVRDGCSVAVVGRLAAEVNLGDGGSSDVWDIAARPVLDGIRDRAHTVDYHDGADTEDAAEAAARSDVAIVVVGYTYLDEGEFFRVPRKTIASLLPPADEPDVVEAYHQRVSALPEIQRPEYASGRIRGASAGGDRTDLRLSDHDVSLIRAVANANPKTIVAIQAGSAVIVDDWADSTAAIVQCWYGGCEAGAGLADVLYGTVNPSGRLPFSVPRRTADLPAFERDASTFRYGLWHGWWHLKRHNTAPRYPFGFGLSYTTFEITESSVALRGSVAEVSATVANTGDRDGADVIQVYAELPDPEAPPRLVGFQRVELPAAGTVDVEIIVPVDRLARRNPSGRSWAPASGIHRFMVARHATDPDARSHEVNLGANHPA